MNTIFNGNSGSNGGCIFVECSLYLEGIVSFTNCSAAQDGGAIHASEIYAHFGCTNVFNANRAVHFGGALYAYKSFLNISGQNTFTANLAGSRGGAIYAQETNLGWHWFHEW